MGAILEGRVPEKVTDCDGVIGLITKNVIRADGQQWELRCAYEGRVPVLLIHGDDEKLPAKLPDPVGERDRCMDLAHHLNVPQQAVSALPRSQPQRVWGGIQQIRALQADPWFYCSAGALTLAEAFLRPC